MTEPPAALAKVAVKVRKEILMLWTIAVVLLLLWAAGMVTSYTIGGLLHLLLVIALVVVVYNLLTGRSASAGL